MVETAPESRPYWTVQSVLGLHHRYPKNIDGYFSSYLSEYHPLFHVMNVAIFRNDVLDFLLLFIKEV